MTSKILKRCKVCGAEYEACISCERNHSWKVHTDTLEHYYIFTVLMTYQVDHDADRAYNALRKRGIDIQDTAGFTPSIQKIMAEIDALAHENSRAKEAVVETDTTKYEEQVDEKPDNDQE